MGLPPRLTVLALLGVAFGCNDNTISQLPVPDIQIDELAQQAAAQVDILWVVDNSRSMLQEQAQLAENFERFIEGLTLCSGTNVPNDVCDFATKRCRVSQEACSAPDYHIAVVSTDIITDRDEGRLRQVGLCTSALGAPPADGRYRYCQGSDSDCVHDADDPNSSSQNTVCDFDQATRFVTATTTNAADAFSKLVRVGVTDGAFEQGIQSAARALGIDIDRMSGQTIPAPPENAGFLRDEASLFVIFVSDEEDKSEGRIRYYYRTFETLKGAGNEGLISLSAIVAEPDIDGDGPIEGGCVPPGAPDEQRNTPGTRYVALSMYSRGLADEFVVCDTASLTCPANQTCQQPVPGLLGVCVTDAPCDSDRACSSLQCEEGGCIQCIDGACQATRPRFLELLEQNGAFASICSEYDEVLDSLGFEAAGLRRKFALTEFPDCGSSPVPCCADDAPDCGAVAPLCVKVDGEVIGNDRQTGWIYEETTNAVFFDGDLVPPTGADVTLSYRRSQVGATVGCGSVL